MPPDQRSWTLSICPECGSTVVLDEGAADAGWICDSDTHYGRSVRRESMRAVKDRYRAKASVHLQVMGFCGSGEGGGEGDGD